MAKEKMSDEKKIKLVYSGELLVFAIVFFVLGALKVSLVIRTNNIIRIIFNWVTLFGGTWTIVDFIWVLCSKKRRKKNSILDKALMVPLGIYLITYDLICLLGPTRDTSFYAYCMSVVLFYAGTIFTFQAIYHYWHPIPTILDAIAQAEAASKEEEVEPQEEATPEQSVEEEQQPKEENKKEETILVSFLH